MRKPQSPATVVRHLRAMLSRSEDNDFTSLPQDEALRNAIAIVQRSAGLERLRSTAASCVKDGECASCYEEGADDNPSCGDHAPFDMPSDDAVDTLHSLISMAREVGPHA